MRIIGGTHKGKKLRPFPGKNIRPTSDRLREAVFSILSDRIRGSRVLDLFAGTGALGIEALSRGALEATFVDSEAAAIFLLNHNIQACGITAKARIIQWNILKNLTCIQSGTPEFTLVFMDPPYQKDMIRTTLHHLHNSRALQKGAWIVIEHSTREPLKDLPAFQLKDARKYGKTLVSFLEYMV